MDGWWPTVDPINFCEISHMSAFSLISQGTMHGSWWEKADVFTVSRRFCPKRLTVIHTYIHSYTDGGGRHARCRPAHLVQGHFNMQTRTELKRADIVMLWNEPRVARSLCKIEHEMLWLLRAVATSQLYQYRNKSKFMFGNWLILKKKKTPGSFLNKKQFRTSKSCKMCSKS